jgi:lactoylglutathione lyase
MKSEFLGLRTVGYYVSNLEEAKKWYAKAFGKEPYFDEPFYVGFNVGGYELGLQPEQEVAREKSENVLAYWGVEDIQKTFERMLSLGATTHEAPQNVGGEIMVATVKDPWNNVIGMIYNPEFKIE